MANFHHTENEVDLKNGQARRHAALFAVLLLHKAAGAPQAPREKYICRSVDPRRRPPPAIIGYER
ncbi:MAG: hypothetical protein QM741_06470 [Rudaea sp.]|uniref:hypothetical protein n=1 Tax=Rudaea sp. TaxID=2136325 RepID=UPI0039E488AF